MGFFTQATALRHRDFRLIWTGQLLSQSGSMMQSAAILWHIYQITGNAMALGLVGLVRVVPIIGFSLLSGVVADTFDRRKLMMVAQTGMGLCALGLGFVAYKHVLAPWPIYLFAALSSSFSAFDMPARQALIPSIVPREDLPNAFSLNATMFQAASVTGPAVGGLVLAHLGLQWAYWINALSFGAILIALVQVKFRPQKDQTEVKIGIHSAIEGLRFVKNEPLIFSTMLLDFFATFFSSATALLPIYARDILKVGPIGYGWLFAAEAVGALFTGVLLSLRKSINTSGKTLLIAVICYGTATVLFGISRLFPLSFLALGAVGASDTVSMVIRNTIRNIRTPDHIRGRMTSVNMIFFMGGPQLGELEAGAVAKWMGATFSVVSGGLACLIASLGVIKIWPQLWNYKE